MTEQPALEFVGLPRQLRAGAKLTQEELAEAASLSPRSVSDLERGINRTARRDTAVLLAGALGLPEPVRAVFVAAARGRVPAAEVLAALRGGVKVPGGLAPGRDPVWLDVLIWGWCRSGSGTSGCFTGRSGTRSSRRCTRRPPSRLARATWEHREGSELTLRGYRRTGGVADAVNRGAQGAYDTLTSAQQDAARLVFTQLPVVTAEGQLARRRCRITDLHAQGAELAADIDAVLDAFLGAAHHAARRGTRRRRGVIAGLLALVVIAVSAAGIAVNTAVNASQQHALALSNRLIEEGLALAPSDPLTARRLVVAAWRVSPTSQAGSAMMTLLAEQQQDGILPGGPSSGGVTGVAFSHNGKLLASADLDGTVKLWSTATRREVRAPLPADTSPGDAGVNGVAFSPDGTLVAGAYSDGTVQTWQVSLFADPYAALCADVGAPTKADWAQYAPGEPQPSVCS